MKPAALLDVMDADHDATRIDLALEPEHRRGHGVLNKGRLDIGRPTCLPTCLCITWAGSARTR
ncbi:hypothetical protein N7U49_00255 [Streptomyces sp. AD2-2]|nr:hypothetical protein N7U49_00255 [Streptomyces sp. AD2-2]